MRRNSNLFLSLLILNVFMVSVMAVRPGYPDEPKTLVWNFDEGAGKVAKEGTGSGNDAKFNEGEGIKWVDGKFDKALEFSGSDADPQWLVIPYSDDMDIRDAITMQAWVYPTAIPGDKRTIITKASYYLQIEPSGQVATYFYDVDPEGYHLSNGRVSENE